MGAKKIHLVVKRPFGVVPLCEKPGGGASTRLPALVTCKRCLRLMSPPTKRILKNLKLSSRV